MRKRVGLDAKALKLMAQPVKHRVRTAEGGLPMATGQGAQSLHELGGRDSSAAGLDENLPNIGQQHQGERFIVVLLIGEVVEGFPGAPGPVAAGDLGDGEEGPPVVGQAVEGRRRHRRVASLEGGEVVLSPTGEFAAENGFDLGVETVETGLSTHRPRREAAR